MGPQKADLEGCGWVILALGKLGAGELNFSSDIDLIILHDPVNNPLTDRQTAQKFYVEQTRSLVRLLSQSTSDGIGWRVDLRLRPDPGQRLSAFRLTRPLGTMNPLPAHGNAPPSFVPGQSPVISRLATVFWLIFSHSFGGAPLITPFWMT